jgi:hypothetical protein
MTYARSALSSSETSGRTMEGEASTRSWWHSWLVAMVTAWPAAQFDADGHAG